MLAGKVRVKKAKFNDTQEKSVIAETVGTFEKILINTITRQITLKPGKH